MIFEASSKKGFNLIPLGNTGAAHLQIQAIIKDFFELTDSRKSRIGTFTQEGFGHFTAQAARQTDQILSCALG